MVAILVILFALAIPGLFYLQKSLRQTSLDRKAETIYTAVQNRLAELYSNGDTDSYNPKLHNDLIESSIIPGDFDSSISGEILDGDKNRLYYFFDGSDIANSILGDDTVAEEILKGDFVVEVIPYATRTSDDDDLQISAGMVYAVYYSEDDNWDVSQLYGDGSDVTFQTQYRLRKNRMSLTDAHIGYYGGSNPGGGSDTTNLSITDIQITSDEVVNYAIVKARKPIGVIADATFTFTLEDTQGNTREIKITEAGNAFKVEVDGLASSLSDIYMTTAQKIGVNYTFNLTLDNLASEDTRFDALFGEESKKKHAGYKNALVSGSDIKLTVKAECEEDKTIAIAEKAAYGNSIFDYGYEDTVSTGYESHLKKQDTASITNARHLQNLDTSSNVSDKITKAVLNDDISLKDDSEFYKQYINSYFNKTTTITKINSSGSTSRLKVVNFKPIKNDNLESITGLKVNEETKEESNYVIYNLVSSSDEASGLLKEVNKELKISNITMLGTKINSDSSDAGVFVGTNNGDLTIENSYVYLSTSNDDIPTSISSAYNLESIRWLQGTNVGGLVGNNTNSLTINKSSASTVLGKAGSTTGGLVGNNTGTINITKSYADSYLYGKNVGGLVGNNNNGTVNISTSYSAGFIAVDNDDSSIGAALVNGSINRAENVYTIVNFNTVDSSNGISKNTERKGTFYSTAKSINRGASSVYTSTTLNEVNGTKDIDDLKSAPEGFTLTGSRNITPYKLMGQSLPAYSYPTIIGLDHYGDWDISFMAGSLVYFEEYKDSNGNISYGFDGAGVDISVNPNGTIVGDGYGIIYKSEPDNDIKYKIGNGNYVTIDKTDSSRVRTFTIDDETYYLYLLNIEDNNPTTVNSSFYSRIEVQGSNDSKYYDFNPHFASCYTEVSKDASTSSKPTNISIRSPRHLYNLSLYYDSDYHDVLGSNVVYTQERNMDYSNYNWSTYYNSSVNTVNSQKPIGQTSDKSFNARYNGYCYEIGNVSFVSKSGDYVGMFGHNTGTIQNVVLATQYKTTGSTYLVRREDGISRNETVYIGVLAGYNNGTINNCAVAGYYLSSPEGAIQGYEGATVYVGGLVGYNDEKGSINKASADSPKLQLSMYRSTCYAAGLVGYNVGSINNAYALNHITSNARGGNTIIAGFAGGNTGRILNSYSATALTSSGDGSYSYMFAPTGGSVISSYYLYKGSYQFVDSVYSYNGSITNTSGSYRTYNELVSQSKGSKAVYSYYHALTNETNYPYRAVITNAEGTLVHYGEWQVAPTVGTYGVFYWEHEVNGQNIGYHLTYIGKDADEFIYDTTLCENHDDGGVISEYGYGYYTIEGTTSNEIKVTSNGLTYSSVNTDAQSAFEEQLPGLSFYPYNTSTSNLYLTSDGINGSVTISYKDEDSRTFYISPFFGNALSMVVSESEYNNISNEAKPFFTTSNEYGRTSLGINGVPGSSTNQYEIRSADQLQYINWNYNSKSSNNLVNSSNYQYFNYLLSTNNTSTATQTLSNAGNASNANLCFLQTHDLNAQDISNFTPIAGQTSSTTNSYTATLYSWFGSNFDGQSYKIQDININSKSTTVGLFGVTAGANIQNVIMYSESGNAVIQRNTTSSDDRASYALGGLIGVAYDYGADPTNSTNYIRNCAIAGYTIQDNSKNRQGLGEANVGGLVGVCNTNIDKCSSVVDIEINCTHPAWTSADSVKWGSFVRVGGIAGALPNNITNSYSGGSITVSKDTLVETYSSSRSQLSSYDENTGLVTYTSSNANVTQSTHVYLAGIAGSGFAMNYTNFTGSGGLKEGLPKIKNCYTYMDFPTMQGTIRAITMITSVADRYGQPGVGNATITNSYYYDDSADFDVNLPTYYFKSNNSYSANSQYSSNRTDFNNMKLGSVKWLQDILDSSDTSSTHVTGTPTSKTYDELSADSMITSLGSSFGRISTTDSSGTVVDGKYSFPAGNPALDGMNYPFPTVIQQNDETDSSVTYNVHYGEWPLNTAYFENASNKIDIFDDMSDDEWAYKTIVLNKNNKDINEGSLEFFIRLDDKNDTSVAEIVKQDNKDYSIDSNGNYVVKVKVKKTGIVDIVAEYYQNDSAVNKYPVKGTITVTANLTASAKENTYTLASEESATSTLSALSSGGKDYGTKVTWTATSSNVGSTTDPAVVLPNKISSNTLKLTGTGYNGLVTAKATYDYHGETYEASTFINVYTPSVIGLAGKVNGTSYTYVETKVDTTNTDKTIDGVTRATAYPTGSEPQDTNNFFLYVLNDENNLLGNALENKKITVEAKNSNGKALDASISSTTTTKDDNGFTTIDVSFVVKSSTLTEPISGNTLKVSVVDSSTNNTYVFELSNVTITPVPYTITLDANGGIFTDTSEDTLVLDRTIENSDITPYVPVRTGYTFNGWYDGTQKVTTVEVKDEDIELKASWTPITNTVQVINNLNKTLTYNTLNLTYDSIPANISSLSNNGYTLVGIYLDYEYTHEFDPNSKTQVNSLVLQGDNAKLYAKYLQNYTVKLNVVTSLKDDGTINTSRVASTTTVNENTTSISKPDSVKDDTTYTLEGWYTDINNGTKVLDSDYKLVDEVKFNSDLDSDEDLTINLYARWNRVERTNAYVLMTDMSNFTTNANTEYLIANSNVAGDGYIMLAETNDNDSLKSSKVTIKTYDNLTYITVSDALETSKWVYSDKSYWGWGYYSRNYRLHNTTNGTTNYAYCNGTQLKINTDMGDNRTYQWDYQNSTLHTQTTNNRNSDRYLEFDSTNNSFTLNSSSKATRTYLYKYTENIEINDSTFVHVETTTQQNDIEVAVDDTNEVAETYESNETTEPIESSTPTPEATVEPIETTLPEESEETETE